MHRIDTYPTHKIGNLSYRAGQVFPFGASLMEGGVNFSVYSSDATGCTLVLYHHSQPEPFAEIPFPESFRIGNVFSMWNTDIGFPVHGSRKRAIASMPLRLSWIHTPNPFPAVQSGKIMKTPELILCTEDRSFGKTMTGRMIRRSVFPWKI